MPAIDTSTPAVVLKFDQNALHHGGLGVIRGLGRFGVPVHCVHEERLSPAAHSRYARGRWLWRRLWWRLLRVTTDAVPTDSATSGLPRLMHVYNSHRQTMKAPTDPSVMPTTVPGSGPEFSAP